jgi:hypothetical protein
MDQPRYIFTKYIAPELKEQIRFCFSPHPSDLTNTSCTSFDNPLVAATFCNAACICFFSAGWYFYQ